MELGSSRNWGNSFAVSGWLTNYTITNSAYTGPADPAVPGRAKPTILNQPYSQTNVVGTDAMFSVAALGSPPLRYQWRFGNSALTGKTNATLVLPNVQPSSAGAYSVVVTNKYGAITSAVVTETIVQPCMNVSVAQSNYAMAVTIPIQVQSLDCISSTALPNRAGTVYIKTAGTTRTLPVVTDGSGHATVYFTPLAGEAGDYNVFALLSGQTNAATQASFKIIGVALDGSRLAKRLNTGAQVTNYVAVSNLTASLLSGFSATLVGPPNLAVQITAPGTLSGNATNTLVVVLQANAPNVGPTGYALRLTSSQGSTNDLFFELNVPPSVPQVTVHPSSLYAAMLRGTQSVVTFVVTNSGGAASGDLQIVLPQPRPSWLALVSPPTIPSLAPEASASATLSLTPSNTLPLGPYTGSIALRSTNNGQIDVPFQFDCVSSLKGNLRITVEDEFTYYDTNHPKVTNAIVTLLDPYSGTNVTSTTTDTSGVAYFTNLTEAYYEVSVEAPQHGGFGTYVFVSGNQTFDLSVFLARQLVSYRWIVTTSNIPDRYTFTLDARFETAVLAPVIRIEPGALDLCNYLAPTSVVNLTIFNSGLITAKAARLSFESHPHFAITPLAEELGDIPAGTNAIVPVVIRHLAGTNEVANQILGHLDWQLPLGSSNGYYRRPIYLFDAGVHDCDPASVGSPPIPPLTSGSGTGGSSGGGGRGRGGTGGNIGTGTSRDDPHIDSPPIFVTRSQDIVPVEVGLRLPQAGLLTRRAFDALLQISNGSTDPLTQLAIVLDIRDTNGAPATNLFGIRAPQLTGLNAIDGSGVLGAQAAGEAEWVIVPATNAAPMVPTRYTIGGSVTYQQAGHSVVIPLFPVPVTVFPDAHLVIDYFWEQIVYSDDPITPGIEPVVPFGLGLQMHNVGFGNALDVRVASAQPQVVDNASGLIVNFQLFGTQVGTQALTPSLTALLGDIPAGSNAVATWWFTASLQGRFINYNASFEHVDDLGNRNLSLVDSIAIHPMIHVARADFPADDFVPDYLVNDSNDVNGLADRLYLSDGSNVPVISITNGLVDAAASDTHTNVHLTASLPSGWVYLRIPDPGLNFVLTFVQRSDGSRLSLGTNVWTTHRIIHPVSGDPYREDFFHLLDYNSTGSYTLGYNIAPVPPGITSQPVGATNIVGTTANFTVSATGTEPLAYQWLKDGVPLSGALASIFTIASVQTNDAGIYSVKISNPGGMTNSTGAILKVLAPPTIDPVSNQFLIVGKQLTITNHAYDCDLPIIFTLDSTAPAGASITTNGLFKWTASCAQGSTTNTIKIWATDSGFPPLSNSISFSVTVPECVQAGLGNTVVQIGHTSSVPVRLLSTVALTNMTFIVEYPPERFTNFSLAVNSPQVLTQVVQSLAIGQLQVSFTLSSNQVLRGPTNVAALGFTALSNASAFVSLPIADVTGFKPDGTVVANALGGAGRIIVIGRDPLLEAHHSTNSHPFLTLYGNPGTSYMLQSATNFFWPPFWFNASPVGLTNLSQSFAWTNSGERNRFFRAVVP